MRPGYSKSKGNQYELKILRRMRKVWPEAHRSIGSGNAKDDKADIFAGPYLVECKFHRKFSRGELQKYWVKLFKEALGANKTPVLVYRENNGEDMVMTLTHAAECWGDLRTIYYFDEWLGSQEECNAKA